MIKVLCNKKNQSFLVNHIQQMHFILSNKWNRIVPNPLLGYQRNSKLGTCNRYIIMNVTCIMQFHKKFQLTEC